MVVPLHVDVRGDTLTATGKLVVKQTDFGSRTDHGGGGLVKVEDEVSVTLRIVARARDFESRTREHDRRRMRPKSTACSCRATVPRAWEPVTVPSRKRGELEQVGSAYGDRALDSDRDATRGKSGRYGDRRKGRDRREKTVAPTVTRRWELPGALMRIDESRRASSPRGSRSPAPVANFFLGPIFAESIRCAFTRPLARRHVVVRGRPAFGVPRVPPTRSDHVEQRAATSKSRPLQGRHLSAAQPGWPPRRTR